MSDSLSLAQDLRNKGIDDPVLYLEKLDDEAELYFSEDPEVRLRGSIFLMLRSVISRKDVEAGLRKLKFL